MFDFKRLGLLLKRDLIENRVFFIRYILVMVGFIALIMILKNIYLPTKSIFSEAFTPLNTLFGVGVVILANIIPFKGYDKKYNRTESIMLPASIEEKFIVNLVLAFVIIPIIQFTAVFIGMEVGYLVNSFRFEKYVLSYKETFEPFTHYGKWMTIYMFMAFSFIGAIVFKKNKLLKTLAIDFGLWLICIIVVSIIIINNPKFSDSGMYDLLSSVTLQTAIYVTGNVLFLLCLIGAYFKLKKERS